MESTLRSKMQQKFCDNLEQVYQQDSTSKVTFDEENLKHIMKKAMKRLNFMSLEQGSLSQGE